MYWSVVRYNAIYCSAILCRRGQYSVASPALGGSSKSTVAGAGSQDEAGSGADFWPAQLKIQTLWAPPDAGLFKSWSWTPVSGHLLVSSCSAPQPLDLMLFNCQLVSHACLITSNKKLGPFYLDPLSKRTNCAVDGLLMSQVTPSKVSTTAQPCIWTSLKVLKKNYSELHIMGHFWIELFKLFTQGENPRRLWLKKRNSLHSSFSPPPLFLQESQESRSINLKWLEEETAGTAFFTPPLFLQEKRRQHSNTKSPSKTFIKNLLQTSQFHCWQNEMAQPVAKIVEV